AVHLRWPPWKGQWWAYHPALAQPPPKTESWAGTPRILAALRARLADPHPRVRCASAQGLKDVGDAASAPRLRAAFPSEPDPAVRRALISALGSFRDAGAASLIAAILRDPGTDAGLKAEAIAAAGTVGGSDVAASVAAIVDAAPGDPRLKTAAII